MVLRRCPRHDLVLFGALGETRIGERGAQEAESVEAAASIHPLHRVDHRRGSRVEGTLDVDRLDDLLDRHVVLGAPHGGQTLRVVGIRRQFGIRYRRLNNLRRAGGRDGLQ